MWGVSKLNSNPVSGGLNKRLVLHLRFIHSKQSDAVKVKVWSYVIEQKAKLRLFHLRAELREITPGTHSCKLVSVAVKLNLQAAFPCVIHEYDFLISRYSHKDVGIDSLAILNREIQLKLRMLFSKNLSQRF